MTKKQIIKPTPVQQEQEAIISLLTGTKKYVKDHKKRVIAGAVILVLCTVFGYAYANHVKKVQENSWAALVMRTAPPQVRRSSSSSSICASSLRTETSDMP